MKTRLSVRCFGIRAEMIKSLNTDTIEIIAQLCKYIYIYIYMCVCVCVCVFIKKENGL